MVSDASLFRASLDLPADEKKLGRVPFSDISDTPFLRISYYSFAFCPSSVFYNGPVFKESTTLFQDTSSTMKIN